MAEPPDDKAKLAPRGMPDRTLQLDHAAVLRFQEKLQRQGSLLVIAGNSADVGRHVVIETEVAIGREQGDLPLRDGRTSRRHAVVVRRGGAHVVVDQGSTNGTRVNGQLVAGEQPLADGDLIQLGTSVLKFVLVDQTEACYLKEMDRLVGTDDLTGLLAKHRFDAALLEALQLAQRTGQPLSAMMMDMDGLKKINDTHGHNAGAATIRLVGFLIARVLGGQGEACRFGGDEFAAFLPCCDLTAAMALAGRIRAEVEATAFTVSEQLAVHATISIGVAQLPSEVSTIEAFLHLADLALYRAKERGRNAVSD